ncbi:MAG: AraC family transcriptional regulator [Desulfovermiculus sp.]
MKFILPPSALRPFIANYTFYEHWDFHISKKLFRALPNGKVEIFFLFNDNKIHFYEKKKHIQYKNFIAGIFDLNYPMKIKITCLGDNIKGLSISLNHRGVNKLLAIPIYKVTNKIIDIESFWGLKGTQLINSITNEEKDQGKIQVLNDFFMLQLNNKLHIAQEEIHYILNLIEKKPGKITVAEIAECTALSYKSIYRRFYNHIGLSPKIYLRIIRFNRACRLLYYFPNINWGELVYHCGYYDQAHFINEFHKIMKESPLHYINSTEGIFYINRPFCFR